MTLLIKDLSPQGLKKHYVENDEGDIELNVKHNLENTKNKILTKVLILNLYYIIMVAKKSLHFVFFMIIMMNMVGSSSISFLLYIN